MPKPGDIPGVPSTTYTGGPQPVIVTAKPAGPDKPQFLQGKMTFIGLAISGLGMLGHSWGWEIPVTEVKGLLRWLADNWDTISEGLGWVIAAYGRFRMSKRLNP